jgi:hypothetical protein
MKTLFEKTHHAAAFACLVSQSKRIDAQKLGNSWIGACRALQHVKILGHGLERVRADAKSGSEQRVDAWRMKRR